MASLNDEIIIKQELRPCVVKYEKCEEKGLFHKWTEVTNLFNNKITVGLVEFEDGTMDEVPISKIKFIDNKIKEYAFEEKKKKVLVEEDLYDDDDLPF